MGNINSAVERNVIVWFFSFFLFKSRSTDFGSYEEENADYHIKLTWILTWAAFRLIGSWYSIQAQKMIESWSIENDHLEMFCSSRQRICDQVRNWNRNNEITKTNLTNLILTYLTSIGLTVQYISNFKLIYFLNFVPTYHKFSYFELN